mgnify:CR=1 FL=1
MVIVPYIVLAVVAALFFAVSYFVICGIPGHGKKAVKEKAAVPEVTPVKEKKEAAPAVDDATVIIPMKPHRTKRISPEEDEKTKVFAKEDFGAAKKEHTFSKENGRGAFPPEPEPRVFSEMPELPSLEDYFVRHFLNRYGAVSTTVEQDTRRVTHHLIEGLHMTSREAVDTLSHIMVQEALQNGQRTYVMMPTPIVLEMVTDAFADVARGSRSDTKTILAYDSLKAMPRMEESEFHALALLLIFHYSRNTDNVDALHLQKYTEKYITPFLYKLPDEYTGYQQLEYLHCLSLANKDIPFGQVLHDSYPLIFTFRGCMKSELSSLWQSWPEGTLVSSLYNSYIKPAAVDESSLSGLFDDIGMDDEGTRRSVMALLESRPVSYDRKEMEYILGKISTDLAKLQSVWDSSMIRRSSLTLMGMYIAKICIRETIGEEFDLSHWM